MIASAIAYFIAALCFLFGLFGFYAVGSGKAERAGKDENSIIYVSIAALLAAWFVAWLGGI